VTTVIAEPRSAEEFCRQQHPRLVRSLAVYTGDRDLAEELAQEALARAYRDWRHVSALERPEAWAHRVAVNLANSHFRRRRYEQAARARAAARTPAWTEPPSPLDASLVAALAALSPRQREALVLRFVLDLSVAATAGHMGCAEGTVRALTAQGVAALRRDPHLSDLEEPGDD
jgi:RNA polymerase sigma factor (sigma-70 family)